MNDEYDKSTSEFSRKVYEGYTLSDIQSLIEIHQRNVNEISANHFKQAFAPELKAAIEATKAAAQSPIQEQTDTIPYVLLKERRWVAGTFDAALVGAEFIALNEEDQAKALQACKDMQSEGTGLDTIANDELKSVLQNYACAKGDGKEFSRQSTLPH